MARNHQILNHPQTDPARGHAPTAVVATVAGGIDIEIYDPGSSDHADAVGLASASDLPFDPLRHSFDAAVIRNEYASGERAGFNGQVWRAVGLVPRLADDAATLVVVNDDYASFVARNRQWDEVVEELGYDEIHRRVAESPAGLPFQYGANVAIVGSVVAEGADGPVLLDQWRGLGVTNEPNCLAWTMGESLRASDDLVDGRFDVVRSARRCLRAEWGFEGDEVAVSAASVVIESTGNVAIVIAGQTPKRFADMVGQVTGVGRNQRKLEAMYRTEMETLAYFGTPIGTADQAIAAYVDPVPAEQIILSMVDNEVVGRHEGFREFPMSPPQQMSSRPPAALAAIGVQHGPALAASAGRIGQRLAAQYGTAIVVPAGLTPS